MVLQESHIRNAQIVVTTNKGQKFKGLARQRRLASIVVLFTGSVKNVFKPSVENITKSIGDLIGYKNVDYEKVIDNVKGLIANIDKIDPLITKYAPRRKLDDMDLVLLSIIRHSIYEGFIVKCTPEKVVINEAIEISKIYLEKSKTKFISGLLGTIYEKND